MLVNWGIHATAATPGYPFVETPRDLLFYCLLEA